MNQNLDFGTWGAAIEPHREELRSSVRFTKQGFQSSYTWPTCFLRSEETILGLLILFGWSHGLQMV